MVASPVFPSRNERELTRFDIRDFVHLLEPAKEKGKYVCPNCNHSNLTWDKSEPPVVTCWNGCGRRDIKEAIKPWAEVLAERHGNNYTRSLKTKIPNPKRSKPKPALIPEDFALVKLTDPEIAIPQAEKLTGKPPKGIPGHARQTTYRYSPSQWVNRYQWDDQSKEKGYGKSFRQYNTLPDGTIEMRKGEEPWRAYRIEEVITASKLMQGTPAALQHEGEGCVEVGREHGLAGFTFQGSNWDKKSITLDYQDIKDSGIGLIVALYDADDAGLKKLQTCQDCADEVGIAFIGINPHDICPDLPYKSSDIKEILAQMEVPEFIHKLEEQIHAAVKERSQQLAEDESEEEEQEKFFNAKATPDLEDPEAFYKSVCKSMKIPYENCVTAGTFDGWVYRKIFPQTEWMVLNSAFYKWSEDNKVWQHQDENRAYKIVADAGEKAFKLNYTDKFDWRIIKPYETNTHKESAFKYSRSRLELAEALPTNTHLLGFKNCVVDLRTGERMPHRKDFYLTNIISHDYEASKPCPEVFLNFITESFGEELVEVIRAFTSMFLDPTAPYGRFPHLIGLSGGGKGTLGRFWSNLFGESGSGSAAQFADISTPEGRHQYLTGKRIFGFPDLGGYAEGVRAFYELVDNGAMSGRALFNPVAYSIQWYIRFWIASVSHLQIENAGDGWMRRAYPIPVKNRNVTPDPDLWLKLQNVKSDVISWALAMPRAERDRILLSPPESDRAKNMALEASLYGDSTKSFVDMCLRPSSTVVGTVGSFMPQSYLHSWYVLYCKEHGYAPLGMSKFIGHLKTILPHNFQERSWTPMVDGKRERIHSRFVFIEPLPGVFSMKVPEGTPNQSEPKTEFWCCTKVACREGGIEAFDQFWKPDKNPEPLRSQPVHPVQGQNLPVSYPGQAETLTQSVCPPCPSVHPKELALRNENEKNSEIAINNSHCEINQPKLTSDKVDRVDSPSMSVFQPVQEIWTAEKTVDRVDSPSVTEFESKPVTPPSLRERFCEVWNDASRMAELIMEVSPEEVESALAGCTEEQIDSVNKIAIGVDEQNEESLYPLGIFFDLEQIDANVESLKKEIADSDWEVISELTTNWKPRFKRAVLAKLSEEERQFVEEIAPKTKHQDDNLKAVNSEPVTVVTRVDAAPEPVTEVESKSATPRTNGDSELEIDLHSPPTKKEDYPSPSGAGMPLTPLPPLLERINQACSGSSKAAELIAQSLLEEVESAMVGYPQQQIDCINNIFAGLKAEDKENLYPRGIFFYPEQIDYSTERLKGAIIEASWEIICELTYNWKPTFKKVIWSRLSVEEQKAVKELDRKAKHQEDYSDNKAPEPVNLHPAVEQKDQPTSLLQIERDGEDIAGLIGYQVEVRFSNRDVKCSGQIKHWDDRNGIITVSTEQGDETAYPRDVFLINSAKPT